MCSYALPLTSKGDQKAEILCSKGKSNGKSEVSWHLRAYSGRSSFHKNPVEPKQTSGFFICLVCALRIHPWLGCGWGLLCSITIVGLDVDRAPPTRSADLGVPELALQPWLGQSCEVCLCFLPLRALPTYMLSDLWLPGVCLVWAGDEIGLNSLTLKCKWLKYPI